MLVDDFMGGDAFWASGLGVVPGAVAPGLVLGSGKHGGLVGPSQAAGLVACGLHGASARVRTEP